MVELKVHCRCHLTRKFFSSNDNTLFYPDPYIRNILSTTSTIAMVGASTNTSRPSYFAMKYLQQKGFKVVPINPIAAGKEILGEKVYADLDSLPEGLQVDMVDVFRRSEDTLEYAQKKLAPNIFGCNLVLLTMRLGD